MERISDLQTHYRTTRPSNQVVPDSQISAITVHDSQIDDFHNEDVRMDEAEPTEEVSDEETSEMSMLSRTTRNVLNQSLGNPTCWFHSVTKQCVHNWIIFMDPTYHDNETYSKHYFVEQNFLTFLKTSAQRFTVEEKRQTDKELWMLYLMRQEDTFQDTFQDGYNFYQKMTNEIDKKMRNNRSSTKLSKTLDKRKEKKIKSNKKKQLVKRINFTRKNITGKPTLGQIKIRLYYLLFCYFLITTPTSFMHGGSVIGSLDLIQKEFCQDKPFFPKDSRIDAPEYHKFCDDYDTILLPFFQRMKEKMLLKKFEPVEPDRSILSKEIEVIAFFPPISDKNLATCSMVRIFIPFYKTSNKWPIDLTKEKNYFDILPNILCNKVTFVPLIPFMNLIARKKYRGVVILNVDCPDISEIRGLFFPDTSMEIPRSLHAMVIIDAKFIFNENGVIIDIELSILNSWGIYWANGGIFKVRLSKIIQCGIFQIYTLVIASDYQEMLDAEVVRQKTVKEILYPGNSSSVSREEYEHKVRQIIRDSSVDVNDLDEVAAKNQAASEDVYPSPSGHGDEDIVMQTNE